MKLIKRIIILVIAAILGTTFYGKFKAIENVVEQSQSEERTGKHRQSLGDSNFTGGIGKVGNPHSQKPITSPLQKKAY